MNVAERIKELRIVPVIKLDRAEDAAWLGQALTEGGLPIAEITFRTDAAAEAIRRMRAGALEVTVGAGTLTDVEQAKRALDAGAEFFVTPGFHKGVVEFALDHQIPVYPGICTPTELMLLLEYGLEVAKFFPAEPYGGLRTIRALGGPFPQMKFMPTGGICAGNVREYLREPKIIACGGSWMVKDELIREHNYEKITELVRQAAALAQEEES